MKVTRSADCGNSPKNHLVEDVCVAMASLDVVAVRDLLSENVHWRRVGKDDVEGLEEVIEAVQRGKRPRSVLIDQVVTHGRGGAANGEVVSAAGRKVAFCHVFRFANARGSAVQRIVSYVVKA